jgi:hypothetical protein
MPIARRPPGPSLREAKANWEDGYSLHECMTPRRPLTLFSRGLSGAVGSLRFPSGRDRRSDHFLCGTGISERFDNRGERRGEFHRPSPRIPTGGLHPTRRLRRGYGRGTAAEDHTCHGRRARRGGLLLLASACMQPAAFRCSTIARRALLTEETGRLNS